MAAAAAARAQLNATAWSGWPVGWRPALTATADQRPNTVFARSGLMVTGRAKGQS